MNPDLEWLVRRWALPKDSPASEAVERLLAAEASGSTAVRIPHPVADWGQAVDGDASPLILTKLGKDTFLQSRALFRAEHFLSKRFSTLSSVSFSPSLDEAFLQSLFPRAGDEDLQRMAVRVASTRQLAVVTGGPGTGKTYTLARILAALAREGLREIRMAAPTGRAADRMKSAVSEALKDLPEACLAEPHILEAAANSSMTLHSLLGFNPGTGRCRFHEHAPLPCEALIVDECSMVDVYLWQAILKALPSPARLILLGDPDQLESVGKGQVFGGLARSGHDPASPLPPCCVHLTEARRFRDRPGIRAFAEALVAGDGTRAVSLLQESQDRISTGLGWIAAKQGGWDFADFPAPIQRALKEIATAGSPEEALSAIGRACILTPQRQFFMGSLALGDAISKALARISTRPLNQPIIINRNDPETGLRNGTVGMIMGPSQGGRVAYFPDTSHGLREVPVARLPDFSPAWAITIHRSQGSEYQDVLVFLPREDSPMATRELLYTAITRARQSVTVVGDPAAVHKAATTPSRRTSLLEHHLAGHLDKDEFTILRESGKVPCDLSVNGAR